MEFTVGILAAYVEVNALGVYSDILGFPILYPFQTLRVSNWSPWGHPPARYRTTPRPRPPRSEPPTPRGGLLPV